MTPPASSVDEAKSLLSVVPFIWAALTTILLATAWRWSSETAIFDVARSWLALLAAVGSAVVGGVVVAVLAPLAYEVTFINSGAVEGYLVLFLLVFIAVVVLAGFSLFVVWKAGAHLRAVRRAQ